MYEKFEIMLESCKFEWDDDKNRSNFRKHGIRFETAVKVFADENKLIRYDEEHQGDEDRYDILGRVGKVLFVVCAFKDDNVIRLISARLAGQEEIRRYNNGIDSIL